jgi:hypothetical protein
MRLAAHQDGNGRNQACSRTLGYGRSWADLSTGRTNIQYMQPEPERPMKTE